MLDLQDIRERVAEIQKDADRGYHHVPMRVVLADLVTPLRMLINAMDSGTVGRWLTLEEVIARTGWSRKYFEKRLASLGDRSRLEVWAEAGKAEKVPPGIWLIHPAQVPPPKPGHGVAVQSDELGAARRTQRTPRRLETVPSVESLVEELLA